jgi:hypothetical protein
MGNSNSIPQQPSNKNCQRISPVQRMFKGQLSPMAPASTSNKIPSDTSQEKYKCPNGFYKTTNCYEDTNNKQICKYGCEKWARHIECPPGYVKEKIYLNPLDVENNKETLYICNCRSPKCPKCPEGYNMNSFERDYGNIKYNVSSCEKQLYYIECAPGHSKQRITYKIPGINTIYSTDICALDDKQNMTNKDVPIITTASGTKKNIENFEMNDVRNTCQDMCSKINLINIIVVILIIVLLCIIVKKYKKN